jgi:hypothetical protein
VAVKDGHIGLVWSVRDGEPYQFAKNRAFFAAFCYRGLYFRVTACFSFMFNPIGTPSIRHPYCNFDNIFNMRHGLFSVTFLMRQRARDA